MKNIKRSEILKIFESYNKENLNYLIDHKKTYIRKNFRHLKLNELQKIVKDYDINKFKYVEKTYGIFVYPDKEFIDLVQKLDPEIEDDIHFYITISKENLNQIDFAEGIPPYLRGLSIAYKLYKMIINRSKFITSDRYATLSAYNLWYNLLQDEDLYCFTSNIRSGLILKNISDGEIISIIDKIKIGINDIDYDDELKSKLVELKYSI